MARVASEAVGGPAGSRVLPASGWWTPVRVALALMAVACVLGFAQKAPCRADAFAENVYPRGCYTDIAPLFDGRGFAQGAWPYIDTGDWPALEYPVLTGAFMTAAAALTRVMAVAGKPDYVTFFDVNVLMLAAFALLGCWFVARTHRRRPWDAVMLAPGLVLTAYINWDLLAVALLAGALWAWARDKPLAAGVFIGLGAAAKLYPVLLLGPLLLLCFRAKRMSLFVRVLLGALWTWLIVNLPVIVAAPDGWAAFYVFSRERAASFGSVWYALASHEAGIPPDRLNLVGRRALCRCVPGHRLVGLRRTGAPAAGGSHLPRRRGFRSDEQGVLTAVRAVAGVSLSASAAGVARISGLAGVPDRLLPGRLVAPSGTHQSRAGDPGLAPLGGHDPACGVHVGGLWADCFGGAETGTGCRARPAGYRAGKHGHRPWRRAAGRCPGPLREPGSRGPRQPREASICACPYLTASSCWTRSRPRNRSLIAFIGSIV